MPAKYHPVTPTVWDRTMRELTGPAKVVRLYVMTCPTRLSEGLFQLPLGHLSHDTGLSENHVREGLAELEAAGLVLYDETAEVVLDRTALKHTPLRNGADKKTGEIRPDKRIPGAVRLFEQVPESDLRMEFYCLALEHSPDLAGALREANPWLRASRSEHATGTGDCVVTPSPDGSPTEGASKGLGRPLQGASREELSRDEVESEVAHVPLCATCSETAMEKAGEIQVDAAGRPWCTWCEGTVIADAS